jgi:hypothetical protein
MSESKATEDRWGIEDLVSVAQTFDKMARRLRDSDFDERTDHEYARRRKLSFDARKFARQKLKND